jgi:hypothetical protein
MPAAASSPVELLKHAPHVYVGGVCCEGEHNVRGGVRQRYGTAATRAALAAPKAAAGSHCSVFGAPRSASVSSWSVQAIPGRKRL